MFYGNDVLNTSLDSSFLSLFEFKLIFNRVLSSRKIIGKSTVFFFFFFQTTFCPMQKWIYSFYICSSTPIKSQHFNSCSYLCAGINIIWKIKCIGLCWEKKKFAKQVLSIIFHQTMICLVKSKFWLCDWIFFNKITFNLKWIDRLTVRLKCH